MNTKDMEEEKHLLGRKASNTIKFANAPSQKKKPSKVSNAPTEAVEEAGKNEEYFGVKSYLHNFYESVTVKNPQLYEDIYEEDFAISHSRKRRLRFYRGCWRFSIVLGAMLLLVGLSFLLFGYLMPHHAVTAGPNDNIEIMDKNAKQFKDFLNVCRIIGLGIFCAGGAIFILALLLPVLSNIQCDEDTKQEPFHVIFVPEEPPRSPTDKKIPATEELESIQPKRDVSEEVVMTNSGLCKVPVPAKASE